MGSSADESFVKVLKAGESGKLLSLDGGGVKGISSLVILQAIMEAVKEKEKKAGVNLSDEERLPRNYFHLAAGTSTGGLIALMLFRLNMSTSEAITAYEDLASKVFRPTFFGLNLHHLGRFGYYFGNTWLKVKAFLLPAQFSDKPLKEAINNVVATYGMADDKSKQGDAILQHEMAGKM
jgi:patatin-like phospholipase/acyl hydrolase